MRRYTLLVLVMSLFATLGVGSLAHATEGLDCAGSVAGLVADHGDHVPADNDNPMPHHHGGCHGHHVGTPANRTLVPIAPAWRESPVLTPFRELSAIRPTPDLRPPIA
ncbi:hypothetical protein [Novosphingobium sp. AP12]|uniref:hypothetical protein n=1 Tax=Novosphingobium sp. AP12 TaxID=1144305 RepID=UPI00027219FA|nr:hypothetical protein [Novosphingobium sp. AP12]EJL27972.1 hypothetical protein PMI02_02688 [Novosphingobium sp. AP12]